MAGYNYRGSGDAVKEYDLAYEEVQKLSDEGNVIRQNLQETESKIQEASERFSITDQEVIDLSRKLELAKNKRRVIEKEVEEIRKSKSKIDSELVDVKEKFSSAKQARNDAKAKYLNSIPKPQAAKVKMDMEIRGPSSTELDVYALGDIHGWAPGLTAYLAEHKLAEVFNCGTSFKDSPSAVYPDYGALLGS